MDDIVLQAMAKWPSVPVVYGWLGLDRRGNWLLQGERIANPVVIDFINRNYTYDENGRWFFQNGPQRVFVKLDYTPLVYRTNEEDGELALQTHTGAPVTTIKSAWLDDAGALLIETDAGIGVIDDRDLPRLIAFISGDEGIAIEDALIAGNVPAGLRLRIGATDLALGSIASSEVARRFGFQPSPAA